MNIVTIIPARMGSSRFPGKPMANILGMPMIGHVWKRASLSRNSGSVYVATCDQEIKDYIESIGGKAVMTKNTHERCTDRTAEALSKIELELNQKFDLVVMIQGDEPMLIPESIDEAVGPFIKDDNINVVNLMGIIKSEIEHKDPNIIKVVVDKNSDALYFSREAIPSFKKTDSNNVVTHKQICIIPFKRDFLLQYLEMSPSHLEEIESIDMLRIMEHGYKVKMVPTDIDTYAVDTSNDLRKVEELMRSDVICSQYMEKK